MPNVGNDVVFYENNIIKKVKNWEILENAEITGDYVTIQPGGRAGFALTNDYFNGLGACRWRKCYMEVQGQDAANNYQNAVDMVLDGKYIIGDDLEIAGLRTYISMNCTIKHTKASADNTYAFTRYVEMQGYELETLTVYVVNNTSAPIVLKNCRMKRSQDISSSQVGESIGWSISLDKVVAYKDGCELYYSGDTTPDVLKWQADEAGNFAGILVNDTRLIKFSRVAEELG